MISSSHSENITPEHFFQVDIRIGTVITATHFEKARKPAYQLSIDFGQEIGLKKSSAQITQHYQPDQLIGRQVAAVVNFPARQIANFSSEVLVLGVSDPEGHIVLLQTERAVENGSRIH